MDKSTRKRLKVYATTLSVPAWSWSYLPVDVDEFESVRKYHVSGVVKVTQKDPEEAGIRFFVLNGAQLLEWLYLRSLGSRASTDPVNYYSFTEKTKDACWGFNPDHRGRYYMIFDNRSSSTPKEVYFEAFMERDEAPAESSAATA